MGLPASVISEVAPQKEDSMQGIMDPKEVVDSVVEGTIGANSCPELPKILPRWVKA